MSGERERGGLMERGGLLEILAQRGGAYYRGGLNRVFTVFIIEAKLHSKN